MTFRFPTSAQVTAAARKRVAAAVAEHRAAGRLPGKAANGASAKKTATKGARVEPVPTSKKAASKKTAAAKAKPSRARQARKP